MTVKEVCEILTQFNLWRRDNHIPNKYEMPNPTQLGIAIDIAIDIIGNLLNNENTDEQ